jgi:hypothetical protein
MASAVIVNAVGTPLAKRNPGGASSEIHPQCNLRSGRGVTCGIYCP